MAIFSVYVKKMAGYVEEMRRKGRQIREISCPSDPAVLKDGLPIKVGPRASQGIILQSETFVELGNPNAGSCAIIFHTDNPSLIRDGKITLIGPDIQESPSSSLPFGQVIMVGGRGLCDEDYQTLSQSQYVSDQIEGYMIRSAPELIWSRVGKDIAKKGFCFETLGRALMAILKSQMRKVQSAEVIFVTSSKEDVQQLNDIAIQVKKIARDIREKTWKAKGYDILECTLGWDCKSCADKPVCDNIRELLRVRKKTSKLFSKKGRPRTSASDLSGDTPRGRKI